MGMIGAAVGGAVLLAGLIMLAILLPRTRAKTTAQGEQAAVSPAATEETALPTAAAEAPELSAASVEPSASNAKEADPQASAPTAAPTADAASEPSSPDASDDTGYLTTPIPLQTTEDRSSALVLISAKQEYTASGSPYTFAEGSSAMTFVNNTDGNMFAAYIDVGGMSVAEATVNGSAVRFYVDDNGVLVLPFGNELVPGRSAELFFTFSGNICGTLKLPRPAYDTVYDIVCCIGSKLTVSASAGELTDNGAGAYTLNAVGVSEVVLNLG